MKDWRLAYRVAFISCAITILIGLIIGLMTVTAADDFAFAFGIICLAGSLLSFAISLFRLIASAKEQAKGFLLSGAILLILSGISCGTGLAGTNFH